MQPKFITALIYFPLISLSTSLDTHFFLSHTTIGSTLFSRYLSFYLTLQQSVPHFQPSSLSPMSSGRDLQFNSYWRLGLLKKLNSVLDEMKKACHCDLRRKSLPKLQGYIARVIRDTLFGIEQEVSGSSRDQAFHSLLDHNEVTTRQNFYVL